jgi:pimeloyl-ACP methyl ester carboxylesterase
MRLPGSARGIEPEESAMGRIKASSQENAAAGAVSQGAPRRKFLTALATAGAAAMAAAAPVGRGSAAPGADGMQPSRAAAFIASHDGTRLSWREWGRGAPALFVHSWCLESQMWDYQVAALGDRGIRCIAYDRRGHGGSDQPAHGYDYDTLADDMASVIEMLDLTDLTLIGHSMGGAEIVRYLSRHGGGRVRRVVLLAPVLPYFTKTADNPQGVPAEMIEAMRAEWRKDFPRWVAQNAPAFFTPETSPELTRWLVDMLLRSPLPVALACNRTVVETDFRAELPRLRVPTLLIHGDKDASAPLEITGRPAAQLIPDCRLKIYEGAPHGLMFTHMARLHADLLEFLGA